MRLQKTIITVSFWATLISFALYIAPCDALLLTNKQVNEVLLAIFGAGVSSLGIGILEYRHCKHAFENKLLLAAEPLISAVGGLRELSVESIGEADDSTRLLLNYLQEEESNRMRARGALSAFPTTHACRDALICAIERCDEGEAESFAQDSNSSSMGYISQAIWRLNNVASSYHSCDKRLKEQSALIESEVEEATYLFGWLNKIPCLAKRSDAKKTSCLNELLSNLNKIRDELEPAFQQARLLACESASISEAFDCFLDTQKHRLSPSCHLNQEQNEYVPALFKPLSQFAKLTKSSDAFRYERPWPTG